ncbi:MAG: hypothetical protein ICV59_01330 [Thermoleophilia bacterium]|nr:hypothetical protein [Thermoleophilia bacterium]
MRPARLMVLGAALTAAVAAPASLSSANGSCTPRGTWGTPRPDLADPVVALVNGHRRARGLAALSVSPSLAAAAWRRASSVCRAGPTATGSPA